MHSVSFSIWDDFASGACKLRHRLGPSGEALTSEQSEVRSKIVESHNPVRKEMGQVTPSGPRHLVSHNIPSVGVREKGRSSIHLRGGSTDPLGRNSVPGSKMIILETSRVWASAKKANSNATPRDSLTQ